MVVESIKLIITSLEMVRDKVISIVLHYALSLEEEREREERGRG